MDKEELKKLPMDQCWNICGMSDYEEVKILSDLAKSKNPRVAVTALGLVAKLKRPETQHGKRIIQPTQINIETDSKNEKKALVKDILSGISDQTEQTG